MGLRNLFLNVNNGNIFGRIIVRKSVKLITLGLIIVILIGTIVCAVFLPELVKAGFRLVAYFGRYIERNPEHVVSHLEETFVIDFPEQIREVKAAKSRASWDGVVGFIVKFTAEPNVVEEFLQSFPKKVEFKPYDFELDTRGSDITPCWFTLQIRQGKQSVGSLGVDSAGASMRRLNIDTTDEKNFVVYIKGGYDSELDY